jgi:Tfp pilus assembly protein PilN
VRPVNLVPPEQRRGERKPTKTGPAAYVVVGALAVALGAITMLVFTNNSISDKKAEVSRLEAQQADAQARAEALRPYAEFASLEQARVQTVTSLAESRFDWQRVLRELAIVIPENVWLTTLTGTARPDVQLTESSGNSLRPTIPGPALEIVGCGIDQEAVAEFIAALEDIDGVTRVAINNSERTDEDEATAPATGGGSAGAGCEAASSAVQFEAIAAFDAVPVTAPTATPGAPAPAAPAEPAPPEGQPAEVADAAAQEEQARSSTREQTQKGRDAVNLIPGTAG